MLTNVSTAFEPNPDSPVYLYVQVADYIAGLIESGELPPGARLLAERDLVQELRDRGLVQTVAVKGTFVVKPDA
jgi:DNA-binding GntR family transcriptional regulator